MGRRPEDFSDDRLAIALNLLGGDPAWRLFECALTQGVIRLYDLKGNLVRLDTTNGSGYRQVTEDGLFQFGHSKDHRPDLPQFKVMLVTLDPLGLAVGHSAPAANRDSSAQRASECPTV